jgi:hypothetical protein
MISGSAVGSRARLQGDERAGLVGCEMVAASDADVVRPGRGSGRRDHGDRRFTLNLVGQGATRKAGQGRLMRAKRRLTGGKDDHDQARATLSGRSVS